ncbi:MAG TPA: hypothetical protein VK400_12780 [Pyrinomonadaceae bacterium]|nr:hypothetical protein [Pyrinomonadaceae bacterium]
MPIKANSKKYIESKFPELLNYKITTSRMYEKADNPKRNRDDWWFKFDYEDLNNYEYIVFAGALDYVNEDFRLFKVPSSYIKANISNLFMDKNGWIIICLHLKDFVDVRKKAHVSFKEFELN